MKELRAKIMEALMSALPITAIVYILALTPWFDFTGVEFMDSSGIGILLNRYKQVKAGGGNAVFYGAGPQVMRILKTGGILGLMKQFATKEAALQG